MGRARASCLWAVPLLAVAIVVLQHHAIRWWTEHTVGVWPGWGATLLWPWTGWGFSAAYEVWNIWSWAESVPYRATGHGRAWLASAVVTSALLVGGPAYQLTQPQVRAITAPTAESPALLAARADVAGLEATRDAMVAARLLTALHTPDAEGRTVHQRIRDARADVERLDAAASQGVEPTPYAWGKVVVQALGVLMLQIAVAVCAVRLFSGRAGTAPEARSYSETRRESAVPVAPAQAESVEPLAESTLRRDDTLGPLADRIQAVREALELRFRGITDNALALEHAHRIGVSPNTVIRDLSLLRNAEVLALRPGARRLNAEAVERLARLAGLKPAPPPPVHQSHGSGFGDEPA